MKNKLIPYTAVFCLLQLVMAFSAVSQEDVETVNDSAFKEQTRPAVAFFHDTHNEKAAIEECNVCHHVYEEGKLQDGDDSIGMECSECHHAEPESSIADLIRAYHLQCSGCHQEQKAGPVLCGECHRRK